LPLPRYSKEQNTTGGLILIGINSFEVFMKQKESTRKYADFLDGVVTYFILVQRKTTSIQGLVTNSSMVGGRTSRHIR